jgi:hypothetical protein
METGVYIAIISDYGFKATFGNEADNLFLRTALQALIKSDTPIREIRFDKNAFEALTIDSRSGIFDLSCTDGNGSQFIVEMQLGYSPHFVQRMKFYTLHKFNTLVERGDLITPTCPKSIRLPCWRKTSCQRRIFTPLPICEAKPGKSLTVR